jgi:hypothetical protein
VQKRAVATLQREVLIAVLFWRSEHGQGGSRAERNDLDDAQRAIKLKGDSRREFLFIAAAIVELLFLEIIAMK